MRNTSGNVRIYVRSDSMLGTRIEGRFTSHEFYCDLSSSLGITGRVQYSPECIKIGDKIELCDDRLALSGDESNFVICCEYTNPEYKKHVPRVFSSARVPHRTIVYRDILPTDKRKPGENLTVRLTERIMGTNQDAPEPVTTYVNLRNQPHQRSYVDDHNKGISQAPMIYKSWDNPRARPSPRYSRPPPGPLSVQYSGQPPSVYSSQYGPPLNYNTSQHIQPVKRGLPQEASSEVQQASKRGKYESEKLAEVRAALVNFFNTKKDDSSQQIRDHSKHQTHDSKKN